MLLSRYKTRVKIYPQSFVGEYIKVNDYNNSHKQKH